MKNNKNILEMQNITKTFLGGKIVANDNVTLRLKRGEVLSVVGENGSGKSTLMNILFGMYKQDAGKIFYDNKEVDMYASGAAAKYKIGMVHQHFHLVDKFTVLDNILIGQEKIPVDEEKLSIAKKEKSKYSIELKESIKSLSKEELKEFKNLTWLDQKITQIREKTSSLYAKRSANSNNRSKQAAITLQIETLNNERKECKEEIKEILTNQTLVNLNKILILYEKAKAYISTAQTDVNGFINKKAAIKRFNKITSEYGIKLKWDQRIADLSVGQRQKVEILKILWVEKNVVVFDEPTATLSVKEIEEFLLLVKKLQTLGVSIIFISHKLIEVKKIANRVVILNKGKFMGSYENEKTLTVKKIARLMVGSDVELHYPRRKASSKKILEISNISYINKKTSKQLLNNVSFDVKEGEIFGLAGIEGNGQEQLLEIISGLSKASSGSILYKEEEIIDLSVAERNAFMSHIATDRFKHAIIPMSDLTFNSFISSLNDPKYVTKYSWELNVPAKRILMKKAFETKAFSTKFGFDMTKAGGVKEHTDTIIKRLNVEGAYSHSIPIKDLSGGNQQKFVVGRELEKEHEIMLAGHPTRGLDIKAIDNIYKNIIDNAKNKVTILFSLEITELLAVCDRLAVFHEGEIVEIINPTDEKAVKRLPQLMVGEV